MPRVLTPARLLAAGLVAAAAAAALWLFPTDSYVFLPNRAHAVAPFVDVEGGKDPKDGGGIYYVDVLVRKATLLERIRPSEGATVVPAEDVRPPGVTDSERRREELDEMSRSQRVAAAVALRQLGYKVKAEPRGARIEAVASDAAARGKLEPGDVVVSAGGAEVHTPADLRRAVRKNGTGRAIEVVAKRGAERVTVPVRPRTGPDGAPILGVIVSQDADIELPLDVKIDVNGVGGPSAGLAFALDVMEELGRDVDRGHKVAVTGAIELDGTVGPIGGVKQKTIGVERAGIDVFLVPAGENAAEARRYAHGTRIVPVKTFQQALRALATLPKSAED